MNRANQNALFQQTNLGLLSIRQSELNYYINLNIAFGTQAALIGGFTYGVFTQNQVNEDQDYSQLFQDIYWVTSAGTIAAAVHVIITTMCIQVLGPGLALHGPVGSMARATEGMRIEQKPVISSFIIMMILFSLSTILSFWAVMSFESAVAGTALYIIAGRYWYYYSERIYLRFYWQTEDARIVSDSDPENHPSEYEPPIPDTQSNPIHDQHGERTFSTTAKSDVPPANHDSSSSFRPSDSQRKKSSSSDEESIRQSLTGPSKKKSGRFQFLPRFIRRKEPTIRPGDHPDKIYDPSKANNRSTGTAKLKELAMEGYLMKKGSYSLVSESGGEAWERRYFTLNRYGQLFMYKTRQDFRTDPKHPIYSRPLVLKEFFIEVINSESFGVDGHSDLGGGKRSTGDLGSEHGGAHPPLKRTSTGEKILFQLTLVPKENDEITYKSAKRQNWLLRCDTEEELNIWQSAMKEVSATSFSN